jgi:hypothetical protein
MEGTTRGHLGWEEEKMSKNTTQWNPIESSIQGDQISRFFASWAIIYFGQFF